MDVNDEQPLNIDDISVISDVSNLDKSIKTILLKKKNIL